MEQFATEEQQVEAIKKFWKENGLVIILGAVIGLGGLWGWRYYSETQLTSKEIASVAYQNSIEQLVNNNDVDAVSAFASAHKDSGYADMSSLVAAQKAVQNGDLALAATTLSAVVSSAKTPEIADIAKIRLARVQMAQANYDDAMATLNIVTADAFNAQVAELKGDIFAAQNNIEQAKLAYGEALDAEQVSPLVQLKLDNLAVSSGS